MKASKRPVQPPAPKKPSARELRRSKVALTKSRKELAKFKQFVFTTLRELESNREMVVTLCVVKDPCTPAPQMLSGMIKGPPWLSV